LKHSNFFKVNILVSQTRFHPPSPPSLINLVSIATLSGNHQYKEKKQKKEIKRTEIDRIRFPRKEKMTDAHQHTETIETRPGQAHHVRNPTQ